MVAQILDSQDEIVKKIIEHSGLGAQEIAEKIRAKQDEYAGLLTEAGAAYSIAKELGVRLDVQATGISALKEGMQDVSLLVRVREIYPVRTFNKNGKDGKVANLIVRDATGETTLVLWNNDADLVEKLQKDSVLSVTGAYVKNGQVNVGFNGTVSVTDYCEGVPPAEEKPVRLSEVKAGMNSVITFGAVADAREAREYVRDGKTKKFRSFLLTDGITRRVVLWDSNAEKEIKPGDVVRVEGYAKDNRGEIEIHVGWRGKLETGVAAPYGIAPATAISVSRKAITELRDGDKGVELRATVVDVYRPAIIDVCPNCGMMVRDGACQKCGAVTPNKSLILNLELDDGRATVRGTLYRNNAVAFLGTDAAGVEQAFEQRRGALLGEEMLLTGDAKHNEKTGSLNFTIRRFSVANPEKEAARIVEVR